MISNYGHQYKGTINMKIVKEIDQNILNDEICLIPTMGALHEGHLSLIKKGKEFGVSTMVTIFINELQFDSKEDFSNYPSKIEDDIKTLDNLDIDYLWAGSTGGGSSLNMIFHNGVDDNEISKVENMLNEMVALDIIADELNYSFETEEYHQTPIKVEE